MLRTAHLTLSSFCPKTRTALVPCRLHGQLLTGRPASPCTLPSPCRPQPSPGPSRPPAPAPGHAPSVHSQNTLWTALTSRPSHTQTFLLGAPKPPFCSEGFFSFRDPAQMSPALGELPCLFPPGCCSRGPAAPLTSTHCWHVHPPPACGLPRPMTLLPPDLSAQPGPGVGTGTPRKHWLRVDTGGGLSLAEKALCTLQTHCKPSPLPCSSSSPLRLPTAVLPRNGGLGGRKPPHWWIWARCFPSLGSASPAMKGVGVGRLQRILSNVPSPFRLFLWPRIVPTVCQEQCWHLTCGISNAHDGRRFI